MFGPRLRYALFPGTVFIYRGPREGLFGPRQYAIGEVLAVDEDEGDDIVHVKTLRSRGGEGKRPVVEVGHIPVLRRQLDRDLVEVVGKAKPDVDCWGTVTEFRRRFRLGEVGAFARRLWQAERDARAAVPPERGREPIAHAFLRRLAGSDDWAVEAVIEGVVEGTV